MILYRGLNEIEIVERKLIPKKQALFMDGAGFPIKFPVSLTFCSENAARNHQKGYLTSGISTSTEYLIALKYATCGGEKNGVVAVMNINRIEDCNVKLFDVKDSGDVVKPEDKEVILYTETGQFPEGDFIERFISVASVDYFQSVQG